MKDGTQVAIKAGTGCEPRALIKEYTSHHMGVSKIEALISTLIDYDCRQKDSQKRAPKFLKNHT